MLLGFKFLGLKDTDGFLAVDNSQQAQGGEAKKKSNLWYKLPFETNECSQF